MDHYRALEPRIEPLELLKGVLICALTRPLRIRPLRASPYKLGLEGHLIHASNQKEARALLQASTEG